MWKIQMYVLAFAASIGFTSTMLLDYRHMILGDEKPDQVKLERTNTAIFYCFISGLFKDHDETKYKQQVETYSEGEGKSGATRFYATFGTMLIALWIEK